MYADGVDGAPRDPKKGADLMKQGCDAGSLRSCAYLSLAYAVGLGVRQDVTTGVQIAAKACTGGDGRACYELARMLISSLPGLKNDEARAAGLFQRACDSGYPNGCSFLADFYLKGTAVPKDPVRAAVLFRRACDGGHGYGCAKTGETFETGRGAVRDEARATALYTRGCNLKNMDACADLGRILFAKDRQGAKKALDQACSDTDQTGSSKLISCAAMKLAFADNRFAFKMIDDLQDFNDACAGGDAHACTSLGLINAAAGFNPAGTKSLSKGCAGGDRFACEVGKVAK